MKSDSLALRVAGVAAMAMLLHLRPATLRENTPQTQMQAWDSPALFGRVKPPLRSEKSLRFFRLRLQGVTHYTLQARSCARLSLWTPFMQDLRPAPRRLRLRGKAVPVTVPCGLGGYPITTVITVTTVTAQRTPAEKRKELNDYALRNPAFPETQGRLCGCL